MPVMYLERALVESVGESDIREIIKASAQVNDYDRMEGYYAGQHDILKYFKKDSASPNNKIVNNMPKYITDTSTSYFIGKPVIYSCDDIDLLEKVQDIHDYNDEQDHNYELAKTASICGTAYEMLYLDEEKRLRYAAVDPRNLVIIYDTQDTPVAAIRTVNARDYRGNTSIKVEFWTWSEVWTFFSKNNGPLVLQNVEYNFWNDVPFVEYPNNAERIGDFKGILRINDAYNRVQSNTANLFQYNDDALLKVINLGDANSEDVQNMREEGAIVLEGDGDVAWLLKDVNDAALENYKNRLFRDMHLFSSVPNLADESFGNNLSGVAMDYKLWNLEQICAIKERKFKKGLQRRNELMVHMLNFLSYGSYDYRDIKMQFRRNKPQNLLELAQIVVTLASEVSKETRLQLLPFIENVQAELQKQANEEQDSLNQFGSYDAVLQALEDAKEAPDEIGTKAGDEV